MQTGQVLDRPVEVVDDDAATRPRRRTPGGRRSRTAPRGPARVDVIASPVSRCARAAARRTRTSSGSSGHEQPSSPRIPGRTPVRPRALARLSREPRRELVVGRLPDPGGMGLPDVGATAHDDVDAGRSRDPHERRGRPADPVLGQVDQRSPACRLEPSELADREALAAEVDVVRVGRPVLADPAEVGQRQPLVETWVGMLVGLAPQPDEQVLVRQDHAEICGARPARARS